MLYLIVSMEIVDGCMERFLEECRRIQPLVLAEQGCLMYQYLRDVNIDSAVQETVNENRITLIEQWASRQDLDLHAQTAHMADFIERVKDMRKGVSIRSVMAAL